MAAFGRSRGLECRDVEQLSGLCDGKLRLDFRAEPVRYLVRNHTLTCLSRSPGGRASMANERCLTPGN